MCGPDLAGILALAFQCWIEDLEELPALPESIREPLVRAARAGFFFGIGKMTYLVEVQRRFGGTAPWSDMYEELDGVIPNPEELIARIGS